MTFADMKLGNQPHIVVQGVVLFQNDKCIVRISKGTLAVPILVDEEVRGHLFQGKGEFILDTIVETPHGAVGKPFVLDLSQPFLMFGKTQSVPQDSALATVGDAASLGYISLEEFLDKAAEVLKRFADGHRGRFDFEGNSHIFAFTAAGDPDRWDMLVSKGDKLVFTSRDRVYVSRDGEKEVWVDPPQVLVARKGKTVVIGKHGVLVDSSDDEDDDEDES